jgi:hypothetical protein
MEGHAIRERYECFLMAHAPNISRRGNRFCKNRYFSLPIQSYFDLLVPDGVSVSYTLYVVCDLGIFAANRIRTGICDMSKVERNSPLVTNDAVRWYQSATTWTRLPEGRSIWKNGPREARPASGEWIVRDLADYGSMHPQYLGRSREEY